MALTATSSVRGRVPSITGVRRRATYVRPNEPRGTIPRAARSRLYRWSGSGTLFVLLLVLGAALSSDAGRAVLAALVAVGLAVIAVVRIAQAVRS